MDFDYLRLISLEERESGKLTTISYDTFDMAKEYITELCEEARSIELFMTRRGTELLDEIESVQSVLQTITDLRVSKIIKLAESAAKTGRIAKEDLKLMIPSEREMYENIVASIVRCRDAMSASDVLGADKKVKPVLLTGVASNTHQGAHTAFSGAVDADEIDSTESKESIESIKSINSVHLPDADDKYRTEFEEEDNVEVEPENLWDEKDFADFSGQSSSQIDAGKSAQSSSDGTAIESAGIIARKSAVTVGAGAVDDNSDLLDTSDSYVSVEESLGQTKSDPELEYEIVCIQKDIESFMGLDKHIYSLSAGDILTLPAQNAMVLCGRNIALNIKVSK